MARLLACLVAACAVSGAVGAVPNLSESAREEGAELILVGKIVSSTAEDVSRREGHVDSVSIAQFAISKVEKGDVEGAQQTVYWWHPKTRPDGWTGHQGQRPVPPSKKTIKVFTDTHGELLVPNGWDFAATEEEEEEEEEATGAAPADDEAAEAAADDAAPAAAEDAAEDEVDAEAEMGEIIERKEHPIRAFFRSLRAFLKGPMALVRKLLGKK